VLADLCNPAGLFHRDTRHLSHLYLSIDGQRPLLLSSTLRDDNATLTCDLTNPDLFDAEGKLGAEHDLIHLRRSRLLWNATCFERLVVRNFDQCNRRVSIEIAFDATSPIFPKCAARAGRRTHRR
jgi:glycogen debranching enzyme